MNHMQHSSTMQHSQPAILFRGELPQASCVRLRQELVQVEHVGLAVALLAAHQHLLPSASGAYRTTGVGDPSVPTERHSRDVPLLLRLGAV